MTNSGVRMRRRRSSFLPKFSVGVIFGLCAAAAFSPALAADPATLPPQVVAVADRALQAAIDAAPPYSTLICNRNAEVVLSAPLVISQPLTIRGLNARLPDGLGRSPLLIVEAEGVTIADFRLRGNAGTVDRAQRSALIEIRAGRFRVEDGDFHDSTKDGVMISPGGNSPRAIAGGVVRNITGYNIDRDVVSISAEQETTFPVEHLLVDNVRCFGSPQRGAVEVSNGSRHITVRKVYAEDCVYAVDIQDHGKPGQINHDILVENVHAKNCQHAVRFALHPFGHHDITLRDVTAEDCRLPLYVRDADRVSVSNIRVIGFEGECPLAIRNCDGVVLRDVFLKDVTANARVIEVENCSNVLVSGVVCQGNASDLEAIVRFRISVDQIFSGLNVSGVLASAFNGPNVVVENVSAHGRLTANRSTDGQPRAQSSSSSNSP